MSAAGVPSHVRRLLGELPASCHQKLNDLHGRFGFTDDQVEAFEVNTGSLSVDLLPAFERFLEQELAKSSAKLARGAKAPTSQGLSGTKRTKFGGMSQVSSFLPSGVNAALGLGRTQPTAAPAPAEEAVTPVPKRMREAPGNDLADPVTPEPPRKQLQVSLKSSVNDRILVKTTVAGGQTEPVTVELLGDAKLWTGARGGAYAWMDESLEERAAERDRRLAELEADLVAAVRARHPELEDLVVGVVGRPSQAEVILCGRILCEGLEGRLNERAMLLEGSRSSAKGMRVQLNVSGCPSVSAFPGQLVAVLGRCGTAGTTFHARDFAPGLTVQPAPALVAPDCKRLLHTMVLSGPFCMRDGLDYSPLQEALAHAAEAAPQVLLLLGPLVDAGNRSIASGEALLPGQNEEDDPLSFEEVYTRHVLPLLRQGLDRLRAASPSTKVLLVPSLEEILNFHPMPQPPVDVSLGSSLGSSGAEQLRKLGVQFLPNPAHLNIEGLRLTVTSADALSPVLRSGLVLRPEEKKIEQALRLILQQRSLFPVLPRDPPQVSEARASALDFPEGALPDVCIFPSASGTTSGSFVDGRLFVNPGSVCRPAALGSFAEIWLAPPGSQGSNGSLAERARVDVKTFSK